MYYPLLKVYVNLSQINSCQWRRHMLITTMFHKENCRHELERKAPKCEGEFQIMHGVISVTMMHC